MENIREYALKTFGIELPEIGLTLDEEIELLRIRNFKQKIVKQDFTDKSGKHWNVNEDFSKLCIEGSGWK